ncbi:phytanoyl-CoA dioxygenase [Klebsiella variicola]|uniref:phytanoyl-CoA dioxygenase n=1 Tax=Klebsiella variicola TaxID=244366 RepID=UPI000D74FB37|nr:phytanoyl-CoA dioxygenase [Klebsiella variicola]PXL73295.1 phytanoyl-CoA dioxygenase [Klebsiella variicola]HCB0642470.1 phytanoyl-CoA dioxygenase [Klebsiella variicola subsp. variicola]
MLSRGPVKNIPWHIKRVSTALNTAVHRRNIPELYKSGNTLISFLTQNFIVKSQGCRSRGGPPPIPF